MKIKSREREREEQRVLFSVKALFLFGFNERGRAYNGGKEALISNM